MSALKIPTQFPWIVAGVVVAHGILAIYLFGGSRADSDKAQAPKIAFAEAETKPKAESPASTTAPHPFAKSETASSEQVVSSPETVEAENTAHFKNRFPKSVPLPAWEAPAEIEESQSTAGEKTSSSLASAVAAANAAPSAGIDSPQPKPDPAAAATRLRIIERTEPVPVPRAMPAESSALRAEPVVHEYEPESAPKLRFKTALPKITKPKVKPSSGLIHPSSGRKFRIVKPINR